MDFFPEIPVSASEASAIGRAIHAVAACDGVHPKEMALVGLFLEEVGADAVAIAPAELAAALGNPELRLLCYKLALLVAHNEGGVSAAERAVIQAYAVALEIPEIERVALEEQVINELLALTPPG
jgi:hypothetical protein